MSPEDESELEMLQYAFESKAPELPSPKLVMDTLRKVVAQGALADAYRWAAHFLTVPQVSDLVWNWLVEEAETADQDKQIALSIAVFELLLDEDIWLSKLFTLLANPKCWWIFLDLYESHPEELYTALARVDARRGADGRSEHRLRWPVPEKDSVP